MAAGVVLPNAFVGLFGTTYLVVLAALWITSHGAPRVGAAYAAVCFAIAGFGVYTTSISLRRPRFHYPDDKALSTEDRRRSKTCQGQTN